MTISIRPAQDLVVHQLISDLTSLEIGIAHPQGSGKTLILMAFVARRLALRSDNEVGGTPRSGLMTHAIITAPQKSIVKGFMCPKDRLVQLPGGSMITLEKQLFVEPTGHEITISNTIRDYLGMPYPGYALVVTQQALRLAFQADKGHDKYAIHPDIPENLSTLYLIFDEAHHIRRNLNGYITNVCRERHARLIKATATPYDNDGASVFSKDARVLFRSYAAHVLDRHAPQHMQVRVIPIGKKGDTVSREEYAGLIRSVPRALEIADEMFRRWDETGRPKVVIQCPTLRNSYDTDGARDEDLDSMSSMLTGLIKNRFEQGGARVLDASGVADQIQQRFLKALETERQVKDYADSKYDVIIAIHRMVEGVDWPICSNVYIIGIPSTAWRNLQMIGRATRLKIGEFLNYPEAWADTVGITYFVPTAEGAVFDTLGAEHLDNTLITCCLLAEYTLGPDILGFRRIRDGLLRTFGPGKPPVGPPDGPSDEETGQVADDLLHLSPQERACLTRALLNIERDLEGRPETAEGFINRLKQYEPDIEDELIEKFVETKQLGTNPKALEWFLDRVRRNRGHGLPMPDAVREAFDAVRKEFAKDTLHIELDPELGTIRSMLNTITGEDMLRLPDRFRPAKLPIDEVLARRAAIEYNNHTGCRPNRNTGVAYPGVTWGRIADAVSLGTNGFPRAYSAFSNWLNHVYGQPKWVQDLIELHQYDCSHAWEGAFETFEAYIKTARGYKTFPSENYANLVRAMELFQAEFLDGLDLELANAIGAKGLYEVARRNRRGTELFKTALRQRLEAGDKPGIREVQKMFRLALETTTGAVSDAPR